MDICDPHFHCWNTKDTPNPNLGDIVDKYAVYMPDDYHKEFEKLQPQFNLKSCVHIEATVGQEPNGYFLDAVEETKFVNKLSFQVPCGIVPFTQLAQAEDIVKNTLTAHKQISDNIKGIRCIMNYDENNSKYTWPQVPCDYSKNGGTKEFRRGFQHLQDFGWSFDCQANPHQLKRCAQLFKNYPNIPVVIDHMGTIPISNDEDDKKLNENVYRIWYEGMSALAKLDHVYVKLSQTPFTISKWHLDVEKEQRICEIVLECIKLFGVNRCMFASNYPVDAYLGTPLMTMYQSFKTWTNKFQAHQSLLFHDNAVRFYKLTY